MYDLTRDIDWVSDRLGAGVARTLVDVFGGVRLYIPQKVNPSHPLYKILGPLIFEALVHEFPSQSLDIPKKLVTAQRRKQIIFELYQKGLSIRDIALATDCTTRWVSIILKTSRRPLEPLQRDFFK